MKKILTFISGLALACSLPLGAAANTKQFSDVSTQYFAEAVYDLAERNIIGGYSDGTFKPGNTITRGQAAAIIVKMLKFDTSNVKNPGFKDVSTNNGYYKAIATLAQKGIIGGYSDGSYKPNDPIIRSQMASIIVKAFDLPRSSNIENPFKDVSYSSHTPNILVLHKFGIVGGTSKDKFSPNAYVTRGQAATMLLKTEQTKIPMTSLKASDFELDELSWIKPDEMNKDVYEGVFVEGKPQSALYPENTMQLVPLKEGMGALLVRGIKANKEVTQKYYVHIKEENGELKPTLQQTDDYLPTEVNLSLHDLTNKTVNNITLSTMDGKILSNNVPFEKYEDYDVSIRIDQLGQYIATLELADGQKIRYGIEAKPTLYSFFYEIETLQEQLSDTYEELHNIGKHTIITKNYEQIASITRDSGTNIFHAKLTDQKEGTIIVEYENAIWLEIAITTGLRVEVKKIGVIWNVHIGSDGFVTDM
ncbi:MAG: S-layer homology domain-containing protein [Solibacillus sp.]